MQMISAFVQWIVGKRHEDRIVDLTISELERDERELDRRISALRSQVEAQTRWRKDRPSRD